jgi:hypothetical protein
MTLRNYYHIYQIFEDYSKQYISFEYTPEYVLDTNYKLSKNDIDEILKNNGLLIKALYKQDENSIKSILSDNELPPIGNYSFAQLGDEDALSLNKDPKLMKKGLPLPVQARYVLTAWNALRTGNEKEIIRLSKLLKANAFKGSLYTQLTLMALSFNSRDFNTIATDAYKTLTRDDTFYLYFKLLSYYFRLKSNKELKTVCNYLSKNYKNNQSINQSDIDLILRNLQ